ncbi:HTH-type transcriptional regulator McbR (plasmid) [Pseudoseohaeicola sp. NH-UV-7]|nr:hypothetical protein C1J05_01550 [Sulfitobacter sp. JL08]
MSRINNRMVEKIQKSASESLSEQVYQHLREALISGDFVPESKISTRTVAAQNGISVMPVREALKRLSAEGALEVEAKRAYRVPKLNPKKAADLFEVRAILEAAGAAAAAKLISPAALSQLDLMCDAAEEAWHNGDVGAFLRLNARFHRAVHAQSGNSFLADTVDMIFVRTGPLLGLAIGKIVDQADWENDHRKLVQALRSGDSAEAGRLMEQDAAWGMGLFRSVDWPDKRVPVSAA